MRKDEAPKGASDECCIFKQPPCARRFGRRRNVGRDAPAFALPNTGAQALGFGQRDVVMAQLVPPNKQHIHPGPGGHPGWHGGGGGGGHWQGGQWLVPGLALGFLGAAAAAATYGEPPEPGMCWYYSDPYRRAGFWDYCH
jgi:hypothetical protein